MTDASFTQITPVNRGATASCPIVFTARIGGSNLSWGRGKTRDVAIDNACRAAFALVAAHGYTDFDCNDDCLTVEPMQLHIINLPVNVNLNEATSGNGGAVPLPPPPMGGMLPPPPPMGMNMNMGMGMNRGMNMNLPPPPLPPVPPPMVNSGVMLIPQAKVYNHQVAVPSVLKKDASMSSTGNIGAGSTISLSLDKSRDAKGGGGGGGRDTMTFQKKIKGGLSLMYDSEAGGSGIVTMEMRRAKLEKYKQVLEQCWDKRKAVVTVAATGAGTGTGTGTD